MRTRRCILRLAATSMAAMLCIALTACQSVEKKTVTREESIPFQVEQRDDASLPDSERRVVTEGRDGVLEVTFEQTWARGELQTEARVRETVKVEPVDEIVLVGTLAGHIVYTQRDEHTVRFFRANADGSGAQEFATFPDYSGSYAPSMGRSSFDSYEIAWSAPYVIMEHYDNMQGGSMHIVDVRTGEQRDIVPKGENHIRPYSFSPDCSKMYYVVNTAMRPGDTPQDSLWVYDLESGQSTRIMDGGSSMRFMFSADGSKVALVGHPLLGRGTFIRIMDADGGNPKDTDNLPGRPAFLNEDGTMLYLDDGKTMVDVAADNSLSNQRDSGLGDGVPAQIHAGGLWVSADAKSYSFENGRFNLIADFSSHNPRPGSSPGFRPDGRAAAFVSGAEGNPEVYVIDASGQLTRCTNDFEQQFDARLCLW